jgi:hypothetical protein
LAGKEISKIKTNGEVCERRDENMKSNHRYFRKEEKNLFLPDIN